MDWMRKPLSYESLVKSHFGVGERRLSEKNDSELDISELLDGKPRQKYYPFMGNKGL